MDAKQSLLVALIILAFYTGSLLAACSGCKSSWFKPNTKYVYQYSAVANGDYTGANDDPSGTKLNCQVNVITPCQCSQRTKVSLSECSVFIKSADGVYVKSTQNHANLLKKFHVEFNMKDGLIQDGNLVSHKAEKTYILNIKRGIIRMLQLKIQKPADYNVVQQWEVFGSCPVEYQFSKTKQLTIHTTLDITACHLHSYFSYHFSPRFLIKTIQGGFSITNVTELQYPFESHYYCDYNLNKDRNIQSVSCFQRQAFRILQHYGRIKATALFNITQNLEFKKTTGARGRMNIPKPKIKAATLPFVFEEEVHKDDATLPELTRLLNDAVNTYKNQPLLEFPEKFNLLVTRSKHATQKILDKWFDSIRGDKVLEYGILTDVLRTCGEKKCLKTIITNLEKLSRWKRFQFYRELGFHFEVDEEMISHTLSVCKKDIGTSCTVTTMLINTYSKTSTMQKMKQPKHPVYQTIDFLFKNLKKLDKNHDNKFEEPLIQILKDFENIGHLVMKINGKVAPCILDCSMDKRHSLHIRNAAIRALRAMDYDSSVESSMKTMVEDGTNSVSIRTEAFQTLDNYARKDIVKFLIGVFRNEKMQQMSSYMASYIGNVLESEHPAWQKRQKCWKDAIAEEKEPIPKLLQTVGLGKSNHREFSRSFYLPFAKVPFGGQIEASIVYDAESLVPKNIILRTKGHFGPKQSEWFEINLELEGMEKFLEAMYKTRGMPPLIRLMAALKPIFGAGMEKDHNGQFKVSLDEDSILNELINLLEMANFPQDSIPGGYIHLKILGLNVLTCDVKEFFTQMPTMMKEMLKDMEYDNLQSTQITKLYRALPTVLGVPFNLTLLATNIVHVKHSSKLNAASFIPPRDITFSGSTRFRISTRFTARMSMNLPREIPQGIEMQATLVGTAGITYKSNFTFDQNDGGLRHSNYKLDIDHTQDDIQLLNVKNRLYIVRGSLIHISADKAPGIDKKYFDQCTRDAAQAVFGHKVCLKFSYPDVFDSDSHPYAPNSGDIDIDLSLKPLDRGLKTYHLEVDRVVKKDARSSNIVHMNIKFDAPGDQLQRKATLELKRDGNIVDITGKIPEFNDIVMAIKVDQSRTTFASKFRLDAALKFLGIHEIFGVHVIFDRKTPIPGVRTNRRTYVNLKAIIKQVIMDVVFENSRTQSGAVFMIKYKYHCPPLFPVLYMLHADPDQAKKDDDVTNILFSVKSHMKKINRKINKNNVELKLLYPANDFTVVQEMVGDKSKADIKGNFTWTHEWGQEFLKLTGKMTDSGSSPGAAVKDFDLAYHHLKDDTFLYSKIKLKQTPLFFLIDYKTNYVKRSRKKRSTNDVMKHLEVMSRKIKAGVFVPPPTTQPKPVITKRPVTQVIALAHGPPGPHHGFFYKFYNFMKNGPKKWYFHGTLQLNTTLQMDVRAGKPVSTEKKLKFKFEYPEWDIQRTLKIEGTYGGGTILKSAGRKLWGSLTAESDRVDRGSTIAFRLTQHEDYLQYSSNITFKKVGTGEVYSQRSFNIDREYGHHCNIRHKTDAEYLKQDFNYHYHKDQSTGGEYIKFTSEAISSRWPILIHQYFSEQKWIGTPMVTPTYEMDRISRFTHLFVNYTSHWKYKRTNKGLTVDLKADVDGKHTSIISMNGHVLIDAPKQSKLPKVSVKFNLPSSHLKFEGSVADEKHFLVLITQKLPGKNPLSVANWTITLLTHSRFNNQIELNPVIVKQAIKWLGQTQKGAAVVFHHVVDVMNANFFKTYPEMVVPLLGMTLGQIADAVVFSPVRVLLPYLDNLPLSTRPLSFAIYERLQNIRSAYSNLKGRVQTSTLGSQYMTLRHGLTVVLRTALKYIQERMRIYPRALEFYLDKVIKPRLMQKLGGGTLEFSLAHPVVLESFMDTPDLTHTKKFFWIYYVLPGRPALPSYIPHVAVMYGNHVVTFDGYVYDLPKETSGDKCTYLLAADLPHKTFAIISDKDGVTLSCSRTRVKIDRDCKIYVNGEKNAAELPYQCPMNMISARIWGPYVIVTSIYGIEIICDSHELKFILDDIHHNHTIGLFGTANGDYGTDLRLTDGSLASNPAELINHFELSKSRHCRIPTDIIMGHKTPCTAKVMKKCTAMFGMWASPLRQCFHIVSTKYYMKLCMQELQSCNNAEMNDQLCSVMMTYVSQCQPKQAIHLPESCIKCKGPRKEKSWNVRTTKDKRDVVIILDQHMKLDGREPVHYVYSMFERVRIRNARMGLVACGGNGIFERPNVYTIEGRHFGHENNIKLALKTLEDGIKNAGGSHDGGMGGHHEGMGMGEYVQHDSHRHGGHINRMHSFHNPQHYGHQYSHLHEALEWAADYPFMPNAGRMIMLFADVSMLKNMTDVDTVLPLLVEKGIIVNIFTNTDSFIGKKFLGINYKGKVLTTKKKQITNKLPTEEFFALVKNTKGIMWNAKHILSRRPGPAKVMTQQFQIQMTENRCRNCTCSRIKDELHGTVQCMASKC